VTPALFKLLEKEWACVAAGQVCAVDADPWLAAQDGDGCWRVADLVGPEGRSLSQALMVMHLGR
jgi:hypothetical protein